MVEIVYTVVVADVVVCVVVGVVVGSVIVVAGVYRVIVGVGVVGERDNLIGVVVESVFVVTVI